ncbi:hypothetical protein HIM_07134 [Hirsutella minnesotensis 3608]|uniref:Uncharacterized protein n=1 Tax=Hirsutella minnesotensis 3608 TaxID=1043627 RepID=A0A0F7ZTR6_9HYPO|nr:hypothetical protein HIM_07134 [Hirsutella minnesotensis 3608]
MCLLVRELFWCPEEDCGTQWEGKPRLEPCQQGRALLLIDRAGLRHFRLRRPAAVRRAVPSGQDEGDGSGRDDEGLVAAALTAVANHRVREHWDEPKEVRCRRCAWRKEMRLGGEEVEKAKAE